MSKIKLIIPDDIIKVTVAGNSSATDALNIKVGDTVVRIPNVKSVRIRI